MGIGWGERGKISQFVNIKHTRASESEGMLNCYLNI